ncbi:MAG: phosphonate C-P lyase system protein PhnG [Lachnospirales bacterium]
MEKKKLSRILEKTDGAILKGLAEPLIEKYPVQVLRKPGKTMVMIRMKETVAKTEFYLGELLACEAMVEMNHSRGFALMAGDDLEKVFYGAVLDAACNMEYPQKEELLRRLQALEKELDEKEQREIRMHQATRVQFETLDTNY